MVELMPELARYVPPAETIDKPSIPPVGPRPAGRLRARECDTLIVSGGETDMCVLATMLGAVDLGYRTVLVQDAVCSSSDENHDSMLELFGNRYGQHVEVGTRGGCRAVAGWVLIAVTKTAAGKPPSFNRISRSLRSKLTEAIPRRPPAGWRRRRRGPSGPRRSWPLPAAWRRAAWPHRPSRGLRPSASGCRSG